MAAGTLVLSDPFRSGQWRFGFGRSRRRRNVEIVKAYRLYDPSGRPIGVVVAANQRPRIGLNAPTVYVRSRG